MFDSMYVLDHWTKITLDLIWKEMVNQSIHKDMTEYIDQLWFNMFIKKIA